MRSLVGLRLKYDVCNRFGLCVLPAETLLEVKHLDILRFHQIDARQVVVESAREARLKAVEQSFSKALEKTTEFFESIRQDLKLPLLEIRKEILPMIAEVTSSPDVFHLLGLLKGQDEHIHQHNIGVGILAGLLGRWLGLSVFDLQGLALAGILHDIGKVKIPLDILNKPGKLTGEERKIMERHTIYGYQILKDSPGISHRTALVALQHHERENGSGYPFGLTQDKIHPFGKMIAVVDVFHAMLSRRPYHEPRPFHEIIQIIRNGMFGVFAPEIASVFLENLLSAMVGNRVVLSDGNSGKIVRLNPNDALGPLVEIGSTFVDLSRERSLQIMEVVV